MHEGLNALYLLPHHGHRSIPTLVPRFTGFILDQPIDQPTWRLSISVSVSISCLEFFFTAIRGTYSSIHIDKPPPFPLQT